MHSNDHIYQFDAHKIDLCSDDNRQDENPQMISSDCTIKKARKTFTNGDALTDQMWVSVFMWEMFICFEVTT